MKSKKDLILSGLICPYCSRNTDLIDSKYIYGRSYGMIYICKPCNAFVNINSRTGRALGRIANKKLRELRKLAHIYFDRIYPTKKIKNRKSAYFFLSDKMGIDIKYCHIGMFNEKQCKQVINISKKLIKGGSMDISKVYYDSDNNKCNIWKMVKHDPEWAANRIQAGEDALNNLQQIKAEIAALVPKVEAQVNYFVNEDMFYVLKKLRQLSETN